MNDKALESTEVRRTQRASMMATAKKGGRWHWFRILLVGLFFVSLGTGIGLLIMHQTERAARATISEQAQKATALIREKNTQGNSELSSDHLVGFITAQLAREIEAKSLPANERQFLDAVHAIPSSVWQEISRNLAGLKSSTMTAQQKVIIFSMPLWNEHLEQRSDAYQSSRKLLFQMRVKEDAQAIIFQGLSVQYKDFGREMAEHPPMWRQAMAGPIDFAEKTEDMPIVGGENIGLRRVTLQSMALLDQSLNPQINTILNTIWEIRGRLILREAQRYLNEKKAQTVIIACDEPTGVIIRHAAHLHGINLETMMIADPRP